MGVPLLLTWLRKRFTSCFSPANSEQSSHIQHPDNLYIDLNSFLYQAAAIVEAQCQAGSRDGDGPRCQTAEEVEDLVLHQLYQLLDDVIFRLVNPKALVYLAVDGVSPLGKLAQQRSRRHRHATKQRRFRGPLDHLWDSNCISVGTHFMLKAAQALHHYAVSRTESVNLKRFRSHSTPESASSVFQPMTPLAIVVDDVLRPGEGETKISEAIRRFRTSNDYNPNTSHVICSSDTDVTVTSLLLHEPRIHVLRYEPPAATSGSRRPQGDAWQSTFFSIHMFREQLRHMLGLSQLDGSAVEPGSALSSDFERALHDIVFLLLLFGNDFLPAVSGSIQEGTLDALLTLLAEDFVCRKRYIVDSLTNNINFEAARYLLVRLLEIRKDIRQERLHVYADTPGVQEGQHQQDHSLSSYRDRHTQGRESSTQSLPLAMASFGNPGWGFEMEEEHMQRSREREKTIQKKCYCYWTMLQWALHYSAGDVKHWSCYYPFSNAPPLDKLTEYCGEISYASLRQFAAREVRPKATGEEEEDDSDLVVSKGDIHNDGDRGQPTDVLVQLLVLLPPQSKSLLPPYLQQSYHQIEHVVNAPMERVDFTKVLMWCEEKKAYLSEAERTRFRAYHFFAQDRMLECDSAMGGEAVAAPPSGSHMWMRASDITFVAFWTAKSTVEEQQTEWKRAIARLASPVSNTDSGPSAHTSASRAKSLSFFGASRAGTGGIAAAEAAMRERERLLSARAASANKPTDADSNADRDTAEVDKGKKVEEKNAKAEGMAVMERPSFRFIISPVSLLGDLPMQRIVGEVDGNHLCTEYFVPSSALLADASGGLSRHATTQERRLAWRLGVTVEDTMENRVPDLLPGVLLPSEVGGHRPGQTFKRGREEETELPHRVIELKEEGKSVPPSTDSQHHGEDKKELLLQRLKALKASKAAD